MRGSARRFHRCGIHLSHPSFRRTFATNSEGFSTMDNNLHNFVRLVRMVGNICEREQCDDITFICPLFPNCADNSSHMSSRNNLRTKNEESEQVGAGDAEEAV